MIFLTNLFFDCLIICHELPARLVVVAGMLPDRCFLRLLKRSEF